VESLRTKERVALLCAGQREFARSQEILYEMETTMSGLSTDLKNKPAILDLQLRLKRCLKLVNDKAIGAVI
jgi:hypothetical protein